MSTDGDTISKAAEATGEKDVGSSREITCPQCPTGAGHEGQETTLLVCDGKQSSGNDEAHFVRGAPPLFSPSPTTTATTTNRTSVLEGLIRAHRERQAELRAVGSRAWEEVRQHAQAACDAVTDSANAEVFAALARERKIEMELKAIAARSSQLQRQMTAWATLFGKFNTELKEMGDLSNWARRIEEDLSETVHLLEEVSERKRRAQGI
ncbi:GCN5-like protein, putative [Trypanosoma cruzi]|uniref:Biogenesis of lysosome-related organelles complex 1 subunit 1 n=1 Tax=Trypanosoma cruzi TaxID=5693 RepID=A0A2V2UIZ1_TRYCR|nr:GCN5-like protein, putative [Trypanosoma cruzi]PBJ68619.1 GCN5-like protein [Trypanosoma cruzi cruzi]KAF8281450.1 putative GCN5-like protein [Trypanosoma cruzi]PBJ77758.1 GCN5-like protein [Trypanosoma cruzi cruzi]PWU83970.1 putative GCN5-like protein [Trypanosoma cruzi]